MHQMLQNLEDSLSSVLNFPCQIIAFRSGFALLRFYWRAADAVPLPNLDLQMPPTNSNG